METFSDSTGIRGSVESLIGGRKENQDSYGMAETRLGMLVTVCDGMGGGPAGKTASSIATQAIIDYVSGADAEKSPLSVLTDAVVSANEAILAAVAANPSLKGMGTTCVCVLIGKKEAYIVHVGDSRCYQLRGGKVEFRTADHSYVGEMVRHGTLTEEEARNSNFSNVITRAIGVAPEVDPEVDQVEYKPGDRFALMTDGIWGTIPEPQLVKFLSQPENPATIVPQIAFNIDSLGADNGGGHDNLTLAIVDTPRGKTVTNEPAYVIEAPDETLTKTTAVGRTTEKKATKKDDTKKEKKKISPAVWGLSVVLACAITAILFLTLYRPDSGKDTEGNTHIAESTQDNPKPDNGTGEESGKESDKSGKESDNPVKEFDKRQKEGNDKQVARDKSDDKTVEDIKKITEKGKAETAPEDAHFQRAIALLGDLKDYTPEAKSSYEQVSEYRKQLHKQIIKAMDKGIGETSEATKKSNAEKIRSEIKLNDKKLIMIDKKEHKSTKEANEYIDKYTTSLQKLIK